MGKLQIDVLGVSFSAQAAEDDEYLKKLLSYYEDITSTIKSSTSLSDPMKISILAGINLVDELYKEKQKSITLAENSFADSGVEFEEITKNLIKKLDGVL